MKKIVFISIALMLSVSSLLNAGSKKEKQEDLSTTHYTVEGKVVDETSGQPVVFANVFLSGSSIGTVTNSDGEFILKVPKNSSQQSISVTYLGYKTKEVSFAQATNGNLKIKLAPSSVSLKEIVVKAEEPEALVRKALAAVKGNYSLSPEMQTGFYRETIKQNRNYVSISEAVLDIYKAPYRESFESDRVKVFKGRNGKDVKKADTVLVKLQGGPHTSMLMDIVKSPGDILGYGAMYYYDYEIKGMVKIDGRDTWIVSFEQIRELETPLFAGKIYIDADTYAIAGIDFSLSEKSIRNAADLLVKKKPSGMKIDVPSGHYKVSYREVNGKWYLNYLRSEVTFKCKWDRKLFATNITAMLEMAVTDRSQENVVKFTQRESAKRYDILSDQVSYFDNGDFWGDYNYIKPDESIQAAIKKLNKKLKRD